MKGEYMLHCGGGIRSLIYCKERGNIQHVYHMSPDCTETPTGNPPCCTTIIWENKDLSLHLISAFRCFYHQPDQCIFASGADVEPLWWEDLWDIHYHWWMWKDTQYHGIPLWNGTNNWLMSHDIIYYKILGDVTNLHTLASLYSF